jgi:hypothetical protein
VSRCSKSAIEACLFDHFVCADDKRLRNCQPKRLGGLEVNFVGPPSLPKLDKQKQGAVFPIAHNERISASRRLAFVA